MARVDARRSMLGRVHVKPVPGKIVAAGIRLPTDADSAEPARLGVELVFPINRQIEKRHTRSGENSMMNRRFGCRNLDRLLGQTIAPGEFLSQVLKLDFAIEIQRGHLLAQGGKLGEEKLALPSFAAQRLEAAKQS